MPLLDTRGYQLVPKRDLFCFEFVGFEEKEESSWLYVSLEMTVTEFSFFLALAHCTVLSKLINFAMPVSLK